MLTMVEIYDGRVIAAEESLIWKEETERKLEPERENMTVLFKLSTTSDDWEHLREHLHLERTLKAWQISELGESAFIIGVGKHWQPAPHGKDYVEVRVAIINHTERIMRTALSPEDIQQYKERVSGWDIRRNTKR